MEELDERIRDWGRRHRPQPGRKLENPAAMSLPANETRTLWQWFWTRVWNLSETTHLSLGWFAPWVFAQMINRKGERVQ